MDYENKRRLVRASILNWKGFVVVAVGVTLVSGLQSCAANNYKQRALDEKDATIIAKDVRCTVGSISKDGTMRLNCPVKGNVVLVSTSLALDYFVKPRPLKCTIFQGDAPECTLLKRS